MSTFFEKEIPAASGKIAAHLALLAETALAEKQEALRYSTISGLRLKYSSNQGQNLAVPVWFVPKLLDSSGGQIAPTGVPRS